MGRRAAAIAGAACVAAAMGGMSPAAASGPVARTADRDCSDFANQRDANRYFRSIGGPGSDPDRLDADGDGKACVISPR